MSDAYKRIEVTEALQLVLDQVDLLDIEEIPLLEASGRVSAADLRSDVDITPFDNAAMDGFAVRSADLESASPKAPVTLKVIAEVPAGSHYDGPIEAGECVRIMTGAPVPAAADSVVKYEIVDYLGGNGGQGSSVAFSEPSKVLNNIREKGEEIAEGEVAIRQGEIINPAGVGFLASCGIDMVPVYRRPKVGVISIGSELVDIHDKPGISTIRDSNGYALCACVMQAGGIPKRYPTVKDDMDELSATVLKAAQQCDFVVTSGGASNGDFDFIKPVVEANGTLLMTEVNMRPGKAQTFGIINGTPVFGLPGNPAAAYCGFIILIRQALRKMQGYQNFEAPMVKARLAKDRKKKTDRRMYSRATLVRRDGELWVELAKNQSSGLFSTMQRANCLAIIPENTEPAKKGDLIDCILVNVEEGTIL